MDMKPRLASIKRKLLKRIEQAAASRDTRLVSSLSALAVRAEEDEELLVKLESRVEAYEAEIGSEEPRDLGSIIDMIRAESRLPNKASVRARADSGEIARHKFIEAGKDRGYSLAQVTGVTYRTVTGKTVAIPFASERRTDRWFLGIGDERPDVVTLLCENKAGIILEFILPAIVISKFWGDLSRSGGQVKFNVSRTGLDYWLVVPTHKKQRLNEYLGAYSYLKNG